MKTGKGKMDPIHHPQFGFGIVGGIKKKSFGIRLVKTLNGHLKRCLISKIGNLFL